MVYHFFFQQRDTVRFVFFVRTEIKVNCYNADNDRSILCYNNLFLQARLTYFYNLKFVPRVGCLTMTRMCENIYPQPLATGCGP